MLDIRLIQKPLAEYEKRLFPTIDKERRKRKTGSWINRQIPSWHTFNKVRAGDSETKAFLQT